MPDEEEGAPAAKQRRRRGDTNNVREDDAETHQGGPKKRGRPRATKGKQTGVADGSPEAEQPPGRRKRRRVSQEEAEDDNADELEGEPATKRPRARPSLDKAPAGEARDSGAGPATRKKRGKAKATEDRDTQAEAEQHRRKGRPKGSGGSNVADHEKPKGRGRPRRSDATEEAGAEPAEPRKRGRPRRSDASDAAAEQQPEPKKRGRPRRSDASDAAEQPGPKKRGRPRRSDVSDEGGSQARPPIEANREPSPHASPEQAQKKPYAYLAPRQRDIPVSTISSTWTPLQPPALAHARQILQLSTRPVLQTLAPGPRRDAASSAIRAATKRLSSKLSKGLPFPPASRAAAAAAKRSRAPRADGREAELGFEGVAAEMEALEGRLQPLLHSIEVLRGEEKRMERVLERETGELEVLAKNGREERKVWREGLRRKGHPLVPGRWDPDGDGGDRLALAPREDPASEWVFTVCPPSPSFRVSLTRHPCPTRITANT